ncbi:MAG: hypothetical protein ACREGH_03545 [Minisyncoccia bacterium]
MSNFDKLLSGAIARRVLWIIGGIIAVLIVFEAGLLVGGRHARLQYFTGFGAGLGPWGTAPGAPHVRVAILGHGAAGVVSSIALPTVQLVGRDGVKEAVAIASTTRVFRQGAGTDATSTAAEIRPGDFVVVIGKPGPGNTVDAQFVRILPTASTSLSGTTTKHAYLFKKP